MIQVLKALVCVVFSTSVVAVTPLILIHVYAWLVEANMISFGPFAGGVPESMPGALVDAIDRTIITLFFGQRCIAWQTNVALLARAKQARVF